MHGREDAGGRAGRTRGGMTGRGPGARRAHRARPLSARGQLVRPRPSSPHGNSSRAGIVGRRLPSHGGGPPERLPYRPMCVLPSPTRGGRCVGREWHRGPSAPEAPALPGPSWRPSPGPRRPGLQAPCTSAADSRATTVSDASGGPTHATGTKRVQWEIATTEADARLLAGCQAPGRGERGPRPLSSGGQRCILPKTKTRQSSGSYGLTRTAPVCGGYR